MDPLIGYSPVMDKALNPPTETVRTSPSMWLFWPGGVAIMGLNLSAVFAEGPSLVYLIAPISLALALLALFFDRGKLLHV